MLSFFGKPMSKEKVSMFSFLEAHVDRMTSTEIMKLVTIMILSLKVVLCPVIQG